MRVGLTEMLEPEAKTDNLDLATGTNCEKAQSHRGGTAYAASHARACADLVLAAVMRGLSPDFVTLDDWMPREIDKQAVHDLIDRALPRLDATQAEAVKAWQSRQ